MFMLIIAIHINALVLWRTFLSWIWFPKRDSLTKNKIRAVIFDFDGTVVNTMPFLIELAAKLMSENYNISQDAAKKRYLETSGMHFASQIALIFPDHPKNQEVVNTFESMKQESIFAHSVFPEIIPTVRYFSNQKIKTFVCSSSPQEIIERHTKAKKLDDLFDGSFGYKPGFGKGEQIDFILQHHKLQPEEVLFVGDSLRDFDFVKDKKIQFIGIERIFERKDFQNIGALSVSSMTDFVKLFGDKDWSPMDSTSRLPHGFSLIKRGKAKLVIRDLYKDRLMEREIHNLEAFPLRQGDKPQFMEGRGLLVSLRLDGKGPERMVIRHYEHGGILRSLTRDLFLTGSRPFRELIITEMARKGGLPTMEVLAAIKNCVFWPFYKGDLVSKEIPNSVDLIQYFTRGGRTRGQKQLGEKRELVRQAGRLVRKMHEMGIYHSDLHLKNFIVEKGEGGLGSLYIIDFDRSKIIHPLKSNKWFANLLRLDRSVEKWRTKGLWITRTDRLRFLGSYLEGDKERKALVRTYIGKYLRRKRRYRMGWAIERLLYG